MVEGDGIKDQYLAGGHKADFIFLEDGNLLKKPGLGELEFYEQVYCGETGEPFAKENEYLKKREFIPQYYGYEAVKNKLWIKIQNLQYNIPQVCHLEIKMGRSTKPENASKEVKADDKIKCEKTTSAKLGFRITGYVIRNILGDVADSGFKVKENIQEKDVSKILMRLLCCNGQMDPNMVALDYYLKRLNELLEFFEEQNSRYFRACSILFILSNVSNIYDLKLIDFAYVLPLASIEKQKDEGFIHGLRSLIWAFKDLRKSWTGGKMKPAATCNCIAF